MTNLFAAWDGIFTDKQKREIISMSKHSAKHGIVLHDALEAEMLRVTTQSKNDIGFVKKRKIAVHLITKDCEYEGCNGEMELYTVCCSDAAKKKQGFLTKWECKKCGRVTYDKRSLTEVKEFYSKIEEVKNGSPQ